MNTNNRFHVETCLRSLKSRLKPQNTFNSKCIIKSACEYNNLIFLQNNYECKAQF